MYKDLKQNENFTDIYCTWIIAYCPDTDSFFATNQRHFFWEYEDEFQCENDAIHYFKRYLNDFKEIRRNIAKSIGGININGCLYLENTKEKF